MGTTDEPDAESREHQLAPDAEFELEYSGTDQAPPRPSRMWSAGRLALSRRQRLLRLLRLLTTVAALLLTLAVILLTAHPNLAAVFSPATPTPDDSTPTIAPVVVAFGARTCIRDAAWSPDSRRIALLVESPDCTLELYNPGTVRVYDVARQRVTSEIDLDAPIFAALGVAPPAAPTPTPLSNTATPGPWQAPTIFHYSVAWSRDGSRLAITFRAVLAFTPTEVAVSGVALFAADGSGERVLLSQAAAYTSAPTEWDLVRGQPAIAKQSPPISTYYGFVSLPAAARYAWSANDVLQPAQSQAPDATPGPIGTPVGDSSFSFWQPGQVQVAVPEMNDTALPPPVYSFFASFIAWSPDGRYLIDGALVAARLTPAGHPLPTNAALRALYLDQVPVLPLRDDGLRQALETLPSDSNLSYQDAYSVAWRPDGRVLALSLNGNDVAFYDCASGRLLRQDDTVVSDTSVPLRWSPDGRWLLLPNRSVLLADHLGE